DHRIVNGRLLHFAVFDGGRRGFAGRAGVRIGFQSTVRCALALVGAVRDGLLGRALHGALRTGGDLLVGGHRVLGIPEQLLACGGRLRVSTGLATAEAPLRRVPGCALQLVATTVERV